MQISCNMIPCMINIHECIDLNWVSARCGGIWWYCFFSIVLFLAAPWSWIRVPCQYICQCDPILLPNVICLLNSYNSLLDLGPVRVHPFLVYNQLSWGLLACQLIVDMTFATLFPHNVLLPLHIIVNSCPNFVSSNWPLLYCGSQIGTWWYSRI